MSRLFPAPLLLLFLCLTGVVLTTFQDYGLVWDSEVQKNYGNLVLLYYLTGFSNRTALGYLDLKYFGGGFETLLQIPVNLVLLYTDAYVFEVRHLLGALTGLGGVFCAFLLARRIGGERAGILAALFLALTPRYYGHMFNNSKDAPLAVFYLLSLYGIVRFLQEFPRPNPRTLLLPGLAMGFAMSIRVGAGVLFLYLLAATLLAAKDSLPGRFASWRRIAASLLIVGGLAWIVMLLFWPWAQVAPILRPIEAALRFAHYDYDAPQLFDGVLVSSRDLPWNYIPLWWLVTVPEFYFSLLLAPLLFFLRANTQETKGPGRLHASIAILALAVLLPVAIAVGGKTVLVDGIRHFLFLTPPLAVLAALTVTELFERLRRGAWKFGGFGFVLFACVTASMIVTARDMYVLHPYQVVYFNRLFGGGVQAASRRFDFDYWGNSLKAGVEWLRAHHTPEPGRVYTLTNCNHLAQIEYWLDPSYVARKDQLLFRIGLGVLTPTPEIMEFMNHPPGPYKVGPQDDPPDFLLATERFRCHERYPGKVLHRIQREGATLLYVIQVSEPERSNVL